jgi:uncharacterized protein (DUF1800 family)
MVLDIVAAQPSTAKHIAKQLCQRFIADTPSQALLDRVAKVFNATGGDLRETVRAVVTSPEMLSPEIYRGKMKSPFEYAVSAVRALGGTIEVPDPALPTGHFRLVADGSVSMGRGPGQGGQMGPRAALQRRSLVQEIATMGQPLFSHEAPTGYPEDSREWLSSGSLLARFNYAQDLTGDKIAAVTIPQPTLGDLAKATDHKKALANLARTVLGTDDLSETTKAAILKEMDGGANLVRATALLLGSPEFQRR